MSQLPVAQPPHNADAERSVLGAMFLDGEAVLLATEGLTSGDFYISAHQEIFSAMMSLGLKSRPVDLVTLAEELNRRGTMMGIGGIPYLTDLSRYVPSAANANSYIRIVGEKATLRRLADAGKAIHADSTAAQEDAPELLERAEKLIYDIAMKRGADKLEPIRPALYQAYAQIEHLVTTKGAITGVPSGYVELDEMTTGFHGGELVLIGSRPSMGKSTLAMNIAQNAALNHGKRVAVFSLEMPREQLAMRMICGDARVDMQQARKGRVSDDEWLRLAGSMNRLADSNIWIDDSSMVTVSHIKSRCRRLQIEDGLDMIIVDYLQLMMASKSTDNRQQEVSEISRGLKLLAQELRVPIVALSQLSRAPQRRTDNRPMLSDLRDSGAIEQDADVVMFLYRDEYYNPETEDKNIAEVILAKQRNGPLGTVRLAFLGQYSLFVNLPPGQG